MNIIYLSDTGRFIVGITLVLSFIVLIWAVVVCDREREKNERELKRKGLLL
jgi:hypothetical protein